MVSLQPHAGGEMYGLSPAISQREYCWSLTSLHPVGRLVISLQPPASVCIFEELQPRSHIYKSMAAYLPTSAVQFSAVKFSSMQLSAV